jgi:DNA-binding NarL/FixJ family response regulator
MDRRDNPIRILIADDHGVLRAGLRALLDAEPDLQVVGEATNSQETLRLTDTLRPDVILLDISMPGLGGIEITRQIRATKSKTHVLILTVYEDEGLLRASLQAGAAGYVPKRAVEAELINAIHAVQRGDLYVHPAMTRSLVKDLTPPSPRSDEEPEPLTAREIEVLGLIAKGHTNRQVADILSIGVRTVETHRANIMSKLAVRGRAELVRYAMDHGLLKT